MLDNNRLEGRLSAGAWPKNENASRPRSGPSENSPAIYRWGSVAKSNQSAKRTAEHQAEIREKPSISAVRYTDYLINLDLIPALKCWAIFISSAPRTIPIYAFFGKALRLRLAANVPRRTVAE